MVGPKGEGVAAPRGEGNARPGGDADEGRELVLTPVHGPPRLQEGPELVQDRLVADHRASPPVAEGPLGRPGPRGARVVGVEVGEKGGVAPHRGLAREAEVHHHIGLADGHTGVDTRDAEKVYVHGGWLSVRGVDSLNVPATVAEGHVVAAARVVDAPHAGLGGG